MNNEEERLRHPLFVGLTRPPMMLGVTVTFLGISGGLSLILFIITMSFVALFVVAGLLYGFGYCCCLYDPRIFDLLIGKFRSVGSSRNQGYWGCNSYDPF